MYLLSNQDSSSPPSQKKSTRRSRKAIADKECIKGEIKGDDSEDVKKLCVTIHIKGAKSLYFIPSIY